MQNCWEWATTWANMEQEWKRGTGEKNVVAIWTCFLLFSHCFQMRVCLLVCFVCVWFWFVLFEFFCWHVNDTDNYLGCWLSQSGLVSLQVPLFGVTVQKLHSIICSNLGHTTSSRWFFMPQVLKWFLLFSKTKVNSNEKLNVLENHSKWNKIAFC